MITIMVLLGILLKPLFFIISYVSNNNSFPKPLSTEEEKKYLEEFAKGNIDARNELIEKNLRLVAHVVKKFNNVAIGMEQDDLISIGTIGLIKAITTFDSNKGTRLATYAARCIENAILSF